MLTSLASRFELLRGLLDFVYPPLCAGCGEYLGSVDCVCEVCMRQVEWYREPLALTPPSDGSESEPPLSFPLFAAGDYTDPLKEVIRQFKFHNVRSVAPLMAKRLHDTFGPKVQRLAPAVIVPIPLHSSREYGRGYNQAYLLARELAPLLDMPVQNHVLVRTGRRKEQAKLRRSQRLSNIRGAFRCITPLSSEEECNRVILVDDVVTSGQTVFEARRALLTGGYEVVGVIAIAHGM